MYLRCAGGSAKAGAELVQKAGGSVAEFLFVIEVSVCEGAKVLQEYAPCYSIVKA